MNLYLVSQDEITGYDTYSEMVVAAVDEIAARQTHPPTIFNPTWNAERKCWWHTRPKRLSEYADVRFNMPDENISECYQSRVWANKEENIKVTYLGVADVSVKPGIIVASFHAG